MLTADRIQNITKNTIISSIENFAKKSLKTKAKFQILDLIIPDERKIRSIVGGLETSLGATLWEPLGRALAEENGFQVFRKDLMMPANMPAILSNALQTVIAERNGDSGLYNAKTSHDAIRNACQAFKKSPIDSFKKPKSGRGVDIWLKKNEINYFFDTKTVQPNLSGLTNCLEQVLCWYAYFYSQNPDGQAEGRIVFPYNPTPETTFWDSVIGKGKPLEAGAEAWVEDEFWDFCSGYKGTYSIIKKSFSDIRASGELSEVLDHLLAKN